MAGQIIDLKSFALDELGRVILPDHLIAKIDANPNIASAGGEWTNTSCAGSYNPSCSNLSACGGSSNWSCSNSFNCNYSSNASSCR